MTEPITPEHDYSLGFSEELVGPLVRRTAANRAKYFLPYLQAGMRVLDLGCGPGSISVGLAQAVAPGELYGVDIEQSQVSLAGHIAAHYRQTNVTYQVADATNLPFADGFFDAVHCHDVLQHIPDIDAALAEVMRVLKSGGCFGCREMVTEACFSYPDFGVINRSWETYEDIISMADGHPQMGKELKYRLRNAGFVDSQISASADTYSTPEDIEFIYKMASRWFLSPEIQEMAIGFGASSEDLAENIQSAYNLWRNHPGALCALSFGEAVAFKP